ncbi:MAG TPA: hypothetical protein VE907_23155 [Gammaproteobacteria bacterium]|nr:hypothetical protein [Gammaproteobacteria bacterium]
MRAIARLCWTYGTALPIQRWVGVLALATWALALLAFALSGPPVWALAITATAMYLLATTLAAGYLCRVLSAPRTHRFLPHFRPRMLAAFLIVVALVSTPGLAFLALPRYPGGNAAAAFGILLVLSSTALMTFSPAWGVACALLVGGAATVLGARSMIAVWAASWIAFAIWYLRTRDFNRLQWPRALLAGGRLDLRLPTDTTGEFSRSAALMTSLSARYPLRAKHLLPRLALLLALVAVASLLLRRFGLAAPQPFGYLAVGLVIPIATIGPIANQVARRTRLLWLTSGLSRRALFAAMERTVWRGNVPWSFAMFASTFAVAVLVRGLPAGTFGRLVVLFAGGTIFAVYLGLAVRRVLALELFVGTALLSSVAVGAWAALGEPPHDDWLIGVTALQLAAAAACRAVTIASWERLDWLTFRPVRRPSQSVRAGG